MSVSKAQLDLELAAINKVILDLSSRRIVKGAFNTREFTYADLGELRSIRKDICDELAILAAGGMRVRCFVPQG